MEMNLCITMNIFVYEVTLRFASYAELFDSDKVFHLCITDIDNFEDVPPCPLSNETGFMSYYLKPEGVLALKKILYVLSCLHPDITYCPLLQPVAALFLHFMDEVWCFACMSSLLSSKKDYFDQTQAKATIADAAFQDCAKMVMVRLHIFSGNDQMSQIT